jgi:hypothetical protein
MNRRAFSPVLLVAGALFFPLLGADGGCGGSSDSQTPSPAVDSGTTQDVPAVTDGSLPPPPPGDGGMMMPPPGDGGMMMPPPGDGGMMPPPGDGGMMPPPGDGGMMMPPPGDGGMMPPPGDGGAMGGDGGMMGPRSCTTSSDCTSACPPGSMGCTCASTPMGMTCAPTCTRDADCPARPGATTACRMGVCAP